MKRIIFTLMLLTATFLISCGGMDPVLKNTGFSLKGPYISENNIFFFNTATNSVFRVNPENGKVSRFAIDGRIYTILESLLPSVYVVTIDEENGQMNLVQYDENGKEKSFVKLGSPFTSFELSDDKNYLIMRHTAESGKVGGKRPAVFFKNEIGILDLRTNTLKKTTLNFSIMDRKLVFSDPSAHLAAILCQEGVIVMDYRYPEKAKYVYLDINKKSPEIDYALFSRTGKYLFLKAKEKDDIYSLSIGNENEDLMIKVNVPSSPYKSLVYIRPVTLNNAEDTFVAQYTYPAHRLTIMSAESNTAYQNQVPLDSGSNIIDVFEEGKTLFAVVANYWLKYIKIVSVYPVAESLKEEIKIFADDFITIGYSSLRDIILLQYEKSGVSIKHLRPQITDKSIKIKTNEFSFSPYNKLFKYSERFNTFFFISSFGTDSSGRSNYQFNYINFNNQNADSTDIDFLPAGIFNAGELSFLITQNSENDTFSLINFGNEEKVITYTGLKYNELAGF